MSQPGPLVAWNRSERQITYDAQMRSTHPSRIVMAWARAEAQAETGVSRSNAARTLLPMLLIRKPSWLKLRMAGSGFHRPRSDQGQGELLMAERYQKFWLTLSTILAGVRCQTTLE